MYSLGTAGTHRRVTAGAAATVAAAPPARREPQSSPLSAFLTIGGPQSTRPATATGSWLPLRSASGQGLGLGRLAAVFFPAAAGCTGTLTCRPGAFVDEFVVPTTPTLVADLSCGALARPAAACLSCNARGLRFPRVPVLTAGVGCAGWRMAATACASTDQNSIICCAKLGVKKVPNFFRRKIRPTMTHTICNI